MGAPEMVEGETCEPQPSGAPGELLAEVPRKFRYDGCDDSDSQAPLVRATILFLVPFSPRQYWPFALNLSNASRLTKVILGPPTWALPRCRRLARPPSPTKAQASARSSRLNSRLEPFLLRSSAYQRLRLAAFLRLAEIHARTP